MIGQVLEVTLKWDLKGKKWKYDGKKKNQEIKLLQSQESVSIVYQEGKYV